MYIYKLTLKGDESSSSDFVIRALLDQLKVANANHQLLLKNFEHAQLDARERAVQDKERMCKLVLELQEDHRRIHEKESTLQIRELELSKREQMINDSEQSAAALSAASLAELEIKTKELHEQERALDSKSQAVSADRQILDKRQSKLYEVIAAWAGRSHRLENKLRQALMERDSEHETKIERLEQREQVLDRRESESTADRSTVDGLSNGPAKKVESGEDEIGAMKESRQPSATEARVQEIPASRGSGQVKSSFASPCHLLISSSHLLRQTLSGLKVSSMPSSGGSRSSSNERNSLLCWAAFSTTSRPTL